MAGLFLVHRRDHARFPYRIELRWQGRTILVVSTDSPWPGAKGNVFALRNNEPVPEEAPVESVPILSLAQRGALIEITLDRAQRKRCNFLCVTKAAKGSGATYEQIFFRTNDAMKAHHTRGHVHTKANARLDIVVDTRERYPWTFPEHEVRRRALPVGDYALLDREDIVAVVERKSFDDAKSALAEFQVFSARLTEMAPYRHAALVVEAQYGDFLIPERVAPMSVAVVARKIAALEAGHPRVRLVFAGNRAMATHWTARYFEAVVTAASKPESVQSLELPLSSGDHAGGVDAAIRGFILGFAGSMSSADVAKAFPNVEVARIRQQFHLLLSEGLLVATGHGRGRRWQRELPNQESGTP